MKKYFCVETDELVVFGDVLHLTFYKDLKDGKVTVEKDVLFTAESRDVLMHLGFIEEREVEEDNNDLLDFDEEHCEALDKLIEDFEALEQRVDKLDDKYNSIKNTVDTIRKDVSQILKGLVDGSKPKKEK